MGEQGNQEVEGIGEEEVDYASNHGEWVPIFDKDSLLCNNNSDTESDDNSVDDYLDNNDLHSFDNDETEDTMDGGMGSRILYEISSDLGAYWDQCHGIVMTPAADRVFSMIPDYNHLSASTAAPQYGFQKGLKLFEEDGYKATVSELQYNLIGKLCVKILEKKWSKKWSPEKRASILDVPDKKTFGKSEGKRIYWWLATIHICLKGGLYLPYGIQICINGILCNGYY